MTRLGARFIPHLRASYQTTWTERPANIVDGTVDTSWLGVRRNSWSRTVRAKRGLAVLITPLSPSPSIPPNLPPQISPPLTHLSEKTLQTLLKAQRAKVEEIKKKTNFYETRDLLSRYERGDSPSASSPSPSSNSKPNANGAGPGSISSPNTPQRAGPGTPGRGKRLRLVD
jgi:hypothetical protein